MAVGGIPSRLLARCPICCSLGLSCSLEVQNFFSNETCNYAHYGQGYLTIILSSFIYTNWMPNGAGGLKFDVIVTCFIICWISFICCNIRCLLCNIHHLYICKHFSLLAVVFFLYGKTLYLIHNIKEI